MMEIETPEIGPYFAKVGPEIGPNADQLTALTRGRGPRRGNLEDLLKYWRPIMKKPGGFRRCVVILMDKPQFGGRPQRICAWLHHELTGKWPNEGNHHGRGGKGKRKRRGKLTRRVRSAARKAKSVDLSRPEYSGSSLRYAVSESRAYGGILVQPIAGRQNVVDMKAAIFRQYLDTPVAVENDDISVKRVGIFGSNSRFGQAAQAVGSTLAPGNTSVVTSPGRSAVFRTLTPGGGSGRGRRLAGAGRRLLGRSGRGARNRFRCPPGFENGGTFTDRRFSTCGAQILGIPNFGPGSLLGGTGRALARLARNAELISSIGDLRSQKNPGVFIRAAQIPSTPKKVNVTARAAGVNTILNAIGDTRWNIRVSKRDGVILEPVAGLSFFANQTGDFDDVVDGSLVFRNTDASFDTPEVIEAVQSLNAGFRDVYFAIPEVGVVRFGREGGELTPADRASLTRTLPTRISRDADLPDPTAGLRGFADDSGGKFVVEFGNLNEQGRFTVEQTDNTLVKVQGPGGTVRQVPQWVYETFLSRSAPRRAKDDPIFELVPEGKSVNPFFITAKAAQPDTLYKEYQADIAFKVDAYKDQAYLGGLNFKRVRPGGVPLRWALGGFTSALAFFDPAINRYRCPPGFTGGGQLTNVRGSTCGSSLSSNTMNILGALQDARGKFYQSRRIRGRLRSVDVDPDELAEGSFRSQVIETQGRFDEIVEDFQRLSRQLPDVDQLDNLSALNVPQLTDDARLELDRLGTSLREALNGVSFSGDDVLDEPSWDALAGLVQEIATVEAQRQAYLKFYGLTPPVGASEREIDNDIDAFARALVRMSDPSMNFGNVVTDPDDITEEGVTAVSNIDQAIETVEALLSVHERGDLWSVDDIYDFEGLHDALLAADREDISYQFRAALRSQLIQYNEKLSTDPDSLSLEEYSYLALAMTNLDSIRSEFVPETQRTIKDMVTFVGNKYNLRRKREFGELDLPISDRSDDALAYVAVALSFAGYESEADSDAVAEYVVRMINRFEDELRTEGVDIDKPDSSVVNSVILNMVNDYRKNNLFNTDDAILSLWMSVPQSDLSDEDREGIMKALNATSSYVDRAMSQQRLTLNKDYTSSTLNNLYEQYLEKDRDVYELVSSITGDKYNQYLSALQTVIDSLYGVDGAEKDLRVMIDLKSRMVSARARFIGQFIGKIEYVSDDKDLLPDSDEIPRWRRGFINRQNAGMQAYLLAGLRGLDESDYDIVDKSKNETTHDALLRLEREGKLDEWAKKAVRASGVAEAKDPSKRTLIGRPFRARTDDGEEFELQIDHVISPEGIKASGYNDNNEIRLESYFFVTVTDRDGNEVVRVPVTSNRTDNPNVVRTLKTDEYGNFRVKHDLIIVNDPLNGSQSPYRITLPDGRSLTVDNRGKGIAGDLNGRFIAMTFAAGFKNDHSLQAAWDGKYVWPKLGARSDDPVIIKGLNKAFNNLVFNYDSAKEAIATGRRLTALESTAWLMFNGDDRKRDRVASLLNFNLDLGEDDADTILQWAQHTEFMQALNPESGSPHEATVIKFFKGERAVQSFETQDIINQVNSLLPEGSTSRLISDNDLIGEGAYSSYTDFVGREFSGYRIDTARLDLSAVDINEAGC